MAVRIQFRRGLESDWNIVDPTLAVGELGYTTDTKKIKFGATDDEGNLLHWSALPVAAAGDLTAVTVEAGSGLKYIQTATTTAGSGTDNFGTDDAGKSGNVQLAIDDSIVITTGAMNAKGDLIAGAGAETYAVLSVGEEGQTLIVDLESSTGLAWGTPTDPTISDGYISNSMLATNSVTEAKISSNAVTETKIASGSVTATKMAANSVATTNIIDANVTAAKLATDSVETDKIKDLNVTTGKLAANAVTAAKVGADVYQRSTSSFTATSAKIFINNNASTNPPTGSPGDIWFRYA
jgi:hypothetical protein